MLFLCAAVVRVVVTVEGKPDGDGGLAVLEVALQVFPEGFGNADKDAGEGYGVLVLTARKGFELAVVFVDEGDGAAHFLCNLLLEVIE